MISGIKLASSFTSFWQELLPTGDAFVRRMNLNKERFVVPLGSEVEAARRALVNEMGFTMFKFSISDGLSLDRTQHTKEELGRIYLHAWETVQRAHWFVDSEVNQLDETERGEVIEIARRLRHFFREFHSGKTIALSPGFPGCGFVDNCVGDVLVEQTLYEVKAGERTFRLVDIRQILVYLALNQSSRCYEINRVGFLNPRMGVFYSLDVDELVIRVAGRPSVELLSDIIYFMSSGGLSR